VIDPRSVVCPHCQSQPGSTCRTSGALGSHSARTHASRVAYAAHPELPPPKPNPAPAAAVAAKRAGNTRPRIRGAACTGIAYRVRSTQRSPSGGLWVALTVSVDGRAPEVVGVELAAADVTYGVPDERALRRAVEAEVASGASARQGVRSGST
jgi:hypothetical protein